MDDCKFCRNGWFDPHGAMYFGQDVECVNGVLIDIDEAHEGWSHDTVYPVAPCHPMWKRQNKDPDGDWYNDSVERLAEWRAQRVLSEPQRLAQALDALAEQDRVDDAVEAVARGLYADACAFHRVGKLDFDVLSGDGKDAWLRQARSAIAAMPHTFNRADGDGCEGMLREAAPTLCSAFRTTVAAGGEYTMVFRFPTIEALHEADSEWHRLRRPK